MKMNTGNSSIAILLHFKSSAFQCTYYSISYIYWRCE